MLPIITLKKVSKDFKDGDSPSLKVLKDINLEIKSGEFFILLGPSGSGKSTLLRLISGLEKEYTGQIVNGDGLEPSDFSFVFQQFALLPWLTVYQNIDLALEAKGINGAEKEELVNEELKKLGLEKFAHAHPKELSGGMRQRIGIARALVTNPKVIFMDEPFSELDSFTAEELRQEILKIWHERKQTIVMVTHLIDEALELADRIAVLTARPGHIEKVMENNLPRPRNKRTAEFYTHYDSLYKSIKP